MFYGYYNYIIFMLPAIIITLFAQIKVKTTFSRYSKMPNVRGLTGAEAARQILDRNGLNHIRIEHIGGNLSDHFDPKNSVIRLSDATYNSATVAAVGVAAHEAGHAVQYAVGYFPIKLRAFIIPVCNFGSGIAPYLILVGLIFNNPYLYLVGVFGFILVAFFQLVTLPVEFNASRRAVNVLAEYGTLTADELSGAKKVLAAAAMTYVAALLTSLLQVFYYLSRFSSRRD